MPGTQRGRKEAKVADLHKASGEDMLEETVHEFLRREGTLLELSGIGGAVLEGDLGGLHAAGVEHTDQPAITESDAVNIRRQVTQGRLPIAHRLAMHDPLLLPDLGWNLCKERCFLQEVLEGSAE